MSNVKRIIAGSLAAMSVVSFASIAFVPAASAQTNAELQAQITLLLAQIAALQAKLGGNTSVSCFVFTRDLTLGSTGEDVRALQVWMNANGFLVATAGPGSKGNETTYFGGLTRTALAKWQASVGIAPAVGYFGPITRGRVNAACTVTISPSPSPSGSPSDTTLHGGEATLTNFDLRAGDDLMEGDTNTEIASAKFDVDNGDINIQRVKVEVQANDTGLKTQPWQYIDSLSVYNGSKKIGSLDVSDRDTWDDSTADGDHSAGASKYYTVTVPVSSIARDGDTVTLSVRADAVNSIDSVDTDQIFTIDIPDQGIRAVDATGVQQYIGDVSDQVDFGFNASQAGDLTVSESSSDPEAGVLVADENDSSSAFTVFKFQIKNRDSADAILNGLTVDVTSASSSVDDIIRKATLSVGGDTFDGDVNASDIDFNDMNSTLSGDDTAEFTLKIELFSQSSHFSATGESLIFSVPSANVDAEGKDNGDPSDVAGTATSNKQSIAVNGGFNVVGKGNTAVAHINDTDSTQSFGTFTLKFDVTAVGDDVYIPKGISTSTASTTAGVVVDASMSASAATADSITTSLTTTADSDNASFYIIHAGDTESFTATVTIDPDTTGDYEVGLNQIRFSAIDSGFGSLQTLDVDQTVSEFHTDPLHITD